MSSDTKLFGGIIIGTVALIIGAAIFFSRPASQNSTGVDSTVLVKPDSHSIASPSATITLVEFGDYQCPACSVYHPIVKQLIAAHKDTLKFVYRHFPLAMHGNAKIAAYAAEAAAKQGKFWEMHDVLYEKQSEWSSSNDPKSMFAGYAKNLGLNLDLFNKDLENGDIKKKVDGDYNDGVVLGVNSTPSFFLENQKVVNPKSLEDFETLIKAAILNAPSPSIAASEEFHAHMNFKVYTNGKALDFTQAKYQSSKENHLSDDVHLHDGVGHVIHVHKKGVTLGDFFTSIGMNVNNACFTDDLKNQLCSGKMYVNGQSSTKFGSYELNDLDKILLSFGTSSDTQISSQIASVQDDACIYSEKCPERGTPPTEECVGGLGTDCQ